VSQLTVGRPLLGGIRTRSLEIEGAGPAFLLLHGYSDSADTWRPLMREMARRGRPAVAVDLPGFGSADPPADGPTLPQLDRFVADLVRERASTGAQPIIVGNSLGGVAALRAAQDPDLPLAGIVAVSPAGLGHQPWVDLAAREPVIHRVMTAPVPMPMRLVRWSVRQGFRRLAVADASRVDPGVLRAYASRYRRPEDMRRFVREARSLLRELESAYELERIERPVLLLWGAKDPLTPPAGAKRVLDAVPGAELTVLDDCGHCAHLERPDRIASLTVEFADRGR
jgi:pimeloyl-ACP methyl ester carboxylesterase